jgi:ABC-type bacteriocin/lantibiotic exporter with double-glycine peptidase domain
MSEAHSSAFSLKPSAFINFRSICVITIAFLGLIFILSCSLHSISETQKNVHLIENVPFFPQEEYQCGPASLAGVLNYYGLKISPEEIANEIYSKSARGTLTIDMVLFAQKIGMSAKQYSGSLDDIRKNIDNKNPVIVMIDTGIFFVQQYHFMVITGYNEEGIIVNSGKVQNKFMPENNFLNMWEKTKYWMLEIRS